jgi:hypothetical protein
MTNYNKKSLTDGRLADHRVGHKNPKIGGQQSNYLVSNDGVQTMDLPRNMLGPRTAESNNRQTPLLIEPLKYIVYNNPQVVYDFLISKGYNVDNKIPSVYQFARIYVKENGGPGILELIKEAHPDKDTILKACATDKKESSFVEGEQNQNTTNNPTVVNKPEEVTESKTESKTEEWIKLNMKTIVIILAIVVFFLLINRTSKG